VESNQITQLKPFKDITTKEAAIWCHNGKLRTMNSRGWGSVKGKDDGKRDARGKGGVASLEMLTERKLAAMMKLTFRIHRWFERHPPVDGLDHQQDW
jgi:hypothetical protein